MGCSSVNSINDEGPLRQQIISLNVNTKHHKKELIHAQYLINLITKLRNKIIYLYHKLIYITGACLFITPNITHCVKSVLYKISSELNGQLELESIDFIDDPPYFSINKKVLLSDKAKEILEELFNFIIELFSYKNMIKQIDKETPGLLYLIFENKENISDENINNINKGIELFKELRKLRESIITRYKIEIREMFSRKIAYFREINSIGEQAYKNDIHDIYEITLLKRDSIKKDDEQNKMYKSVSDGKKNMEKILNEEKLDDILSDSINKNFMNK